MCGICGFVKFNGDVNPGDEKIVGDMVKTLIHRGPDDQKTLLFDNVAYGFSRLSIIGLGNGMQPIFNEDESIALICNGEVFNYIELREELRKAGHKFRTESDVEVIVHLYETYGIDFLNKLNGQFAFALYDKRKKMLFCARDQMGIVPLYYTMVNETFIFGSEIKAILQHPLVRPEVDTVGLDQVMTFAGLVSPRTMFKNIHSLENGHFLRVSPEGEIHKKEYWDLVYPEGERPMNGKPEDAYIDELEALFEDSIRLRLRSDVPLALYLSGGLDSSMIAMKVNQMHPEVRKDAFSIDFSDSEHSESFYQKLVAKEGNARLNQKLFHFTDISERLQNSVYHSECPIKETYNTASLALSEAVRSKGIKVILSGEGADEFFAGYVGYRFDKMRAMKLVDNPVSEEEKAIREKLWGDPDFYYERNFVEYDAIKKGLYSEQLNASYGDVNCLNYHLINKERIRNRDVLNKRAYIDYKIRLVDHLVSDHGDRMALANSVEARYPFLDKNLVEFSTKLPSDLKLKDLTEKYILRKMAGRFVPKQVIEREKFHFVAPGSPYLLQNNIEYVNDILSYDLIKRQGFFNPDKVEALKNVYRKDGFKVNWPYENDLLITVLTFGILLDKFFN
ncbi:MAG: asparagine synthase (glutamine-hydrolyzing) [Bacteroidota bacterium]